MNKDSGVDLTALKVDGGMVFNETLMQFQSDILGVPVIRPTVAETTAPSALRMQRSGCWILEKVEDLRSTGVRTRNGTQDGCRYPRQTLQGWKESGLPAPSVGRKDLYRSFRIKGRSLAASP